jgi:hypothetical protein
VTRRKLFAYPGDPTPVDQSVVIHYMNWAIESRNYTYSTQNIFFFPLNWSLTPDTRSNYTIAR